MQDPKLVWRFGRWVASKEPGVARLGWADGELLLGLRNGNVVAVEGPDPSLLGRMLECEASGHDDLLDEARSIASEQDVSEAQALGAAKQILQEALASWFVDPYRTLEIVDEVPGEDDGSTISATHAIVELLLADTQHEFDHQILPDFNVVLQRAPNFLELYSPLRLSEEADLVVAKITGQRTAQEISGQSSSDGSEVGRLLAALVATGLLEPIPVEEAEEDMGRLSVDLPFEEPTRKELPVAWIAAGIALVVGVLIIVAWLTLKPDDVQPAPPSEAWTLVVDMGCEPEELQRVLKKARQHPDDLRPVQANTGDDNPCWRLIWGEFETREAAEQGAAGLPAALRMDGFEPHPIELPEEAPQTSSE
jgi:hypothetical protein